MPTVRLIKKVRILLIVLIVGSYNLLVGQVINLKKFGIDEGINHPTVYCIGQDLNGFIWLGTGEGMIWFDGTRFSNTILKDSLSGVYPNCLLNDQKGRIWFGMNDGTIAITNGLKASIVSRDSVNPSIINGFVQFDDKIVFAASQNAGIYVFNNYQFSTRIKEGLNRNIYSISKQGNILLIGSSDGMYQYSIDLKNEKLTEIAKIEGLPYSRINSINPSSIIKGLYFIGTDDAGFFSVLYNEDSKKYTVFDLGKQVGLGESNIQNILHVGENNIWVSTFGEGLLNMKYNEMTNEVQTKMIYNQQSGLADNFVKSLFIDIEGNLWLGTYSNGLSAIVDEAFTFYNFKNEGISSDILAIETDSNQYWLGGRNILIKKGIDSKLDKIFGQSNGLPSDAIISLHQNEKTLWIGTEKKGIYRMDLNSSAITNYYTSSNSLENKINALATINGHLWVATNGGVFDFTVATKEFKKYTVDNGGLPHNKINSLIISPLGDVLIATKSNSIMSVNSNKIYRISNAGELEFTSLYFSDDQTLWASTYGDGVFQFHSQDSLNYYSEANGLKSDFCYSITSDYNGNIWVGHRLGISKIIPQNKSIITYGIEIGLKGDCNPNALKKDPSGVLRFGTSDGIVQYNSGKGKSTFLPPKTNIVSIKINDIEYDPSRPIRLRAGKYKIRIEFVGLNFKSPNTVKYQYKLDGWESQWSELSGDNIALYPRVEDGEYRFILKSFNAEGISSELPYELIIYISPPLWKRWWFILIVLVALVWAIVGYIKYRERKQVEFQQYLQRMLDERTREVMEQKEEIEHKNRDITDSITYAQKIQNSILPSMRKVQESFSGCFIMYQPRDIVSGDFYWFDRISDDKFIIVCADSTGHGVPGALMSMIGTTLIKDICTRPDVVSPLDVLQKLDGEMLRTLNQNFEAERSSDGMDLIVCEINTQNYIVKIASAMRPVILYSNHEEIYISGSKSSIGGETFMDQEKEFEELSYQLGKGDLIYMFSDGFPDQFGGPMGKKFKMTRMRNLIKDIYQLPMEEQYNYIRNSFNIWKNNYEQVDDVLFMGIKL